MKKLIFATQKFKAIQRVLETHEEAFTGKAQALAARESFTTLVTEMSTLITDLTVPLTSVYYNRVKARDSLLSSLGNTLHIGIMLASRIGDDVLLNTLKNHMRRYRSVSANEVLQFSFYFINTITQKVEQAAEVGLTQADITQLQAMTEAYQEAVEVVANTLGERRSRHNRLDQLIKDGNKLLVNDLDRFVSYNSTGFPGLSFAYNRVRWSRRRRSSGGTLSSESDISGMITDTITGLPVVGATINIIEQAHAINSDTDGYYIFDELEKGEYTVTCHATGFAVPDPFLVTLGVNDSVIHNFTLTPIPTVTN